MKQSRPTSSAGFTLIELLVVVAILAVVAAVALPALVRARVAANETSAIASLRSIHSAQGAYSTICAKGGFAQTLSDLAPANGIEPGVHLGDALEQRRLQVGLYRQRRA